MYYIKIFTKKRSAQNISINFQFILSFVAHMLQHFKSVKLPKRE